MWTQIKTATEIEAMRESGRMLATVLEVVAKQVVAGISTKELANLAASEVKSLGGKPSFLGYKGFPDVICISVNDEIVHGIPRTTKLLAEGDLVGLDFGVTYRGMITDSAVTLIAGIARRKDHQMLLKTAQDALWAGIQAAHDKVQIGDIGASIEAVIKPHKYGIVKDLVGHGVGHHLHEDPNIPNYGRPHTGAWLSAGMTIAIEPMITLGNDQVYMANDNWTIKTVDGSWAAHFEHTILVQQDGAEILTQL